MHARRYVQPHVRCSRCKLCAAVWQVDQASSYLTLGEFTFASTVQSFLATTLALGNASHLAIADLALAPGATIGPPGTQPVTLRAEFTVSPASLAVESQVGTLWCSLSPQKLRGARPPCTNPQSTTAHPPDPFSVVL